VEIGIFSVSVSLVLKGEEPGYCDSRLGREKTATEKGRGKRKERGKNQSWDHTYTEIPERSPSLAGERSEGVTAPDGQSSKEPLGGKNWATNCNIPKSLRVMEKDLVWDFYTGEKGETKRE